MPYRPEGPLDALDLILVGYSPAQTDKALRFCHRAFTSLPVRRRILVINNDHIPASSAGW